MTNQRPIFVPKGQKADIFANSKELQMLNSLGYFGNDYFFLRIHKTIGIFYENYKVSLVSTNGLLFELPKFNSLLQNR